MPVQQFKYGRIVIVESLPTDELASGTALYEQIVDSSPVEVELIQCVGTNQWKDILRELTLSAKAGGLPILHVECHGNKDLGLQFRDGSILGWQEVAEGLSKLNLAMNFNLVAVFSACFGAYFLRAVEISRAPCYGFIGPTETVNEYELLGSLRIFYRILFEARDVAAAINAMSTVSMTNGGWFARTADHWFLELVTGYVEAFHTHEQMKIRALDTHRKKSAPETSIGGTKRQLKMLARKDLPGKYFEAFFALDVLPANAVRFHFVKQELQSRIQALRETGKYDI